MPIPGWEKTMQTALVGFPVSTGFSLDVGKAPTAGHWSHRLLPSGQRCQIQTVHCHPPAAPRGRGEPGLNWGLWRAPRCAVPWGTTQGSGWAVRPEAV